MDESMSELNASEDLIVLFGRLKQYLREVTEEKEKLRQELDFREQKEEWNRQLMDSLREQLETNKNCLDSQSNAFNRINQIKDENMKLKANVSELSAILNNTKQSNEQSIETIESEMKSKITELKKKLESNEKQIQDLNLTINSKDILLSQSKRELSDNKTKCEENIEEIKDFYEKKIQSLYKEFDEKYQKCLETNDEKVIEIKANSLRIIDKTKEEFESKLNKYKNENEELNQQLRHLRLEFEARNMSNTFGFGNKSAAKGSAVKSKLSIRVLGSEDEQNTVQLVGPTKRKKLIANSDSYLEFIRDEN